MATTQQIMDAADDLGKLIAEHESTKKLADISKQFREDTDAQRIVNDYSRQLAAVQKKQEEQQPIEVEDKRKLEQLQQAMIGNTLLRDMQIVQMDYLDLMRRVDEAIQGAGDQPLPGAGPAPAPAESPIINPDLRG